MIVHHLAPRIHHGRRPSNIIAEGNRVVTCPPWRSSCRTIKGLVPIKLLLDGDGGGGGGGGGAGDGAPLWLSWELEDVVERKWSFLLTGTETLSSVSSDRFGVAVGGEEDGERESI